MRKKLLLNYLYICMLSILFQSPSCLAQTTNLAASNSDSEVRGNDEHTVELKQDEAAQTTDETNQRIQHDELIDKQARDTARRVRRKREVGDAVNSLRLQGSSNPSSRTGLTSGTQRFKKSDHLMDKNSRKSVGEKRNVKISSGAGEASIPEDRGDQDKRDLHKRQGVASRSSVSIGEKEGKSSQKEAKRSSYSSEGVKVMKPKSRSVKESDMAAHGSFAKDNLKVHDNGRYAALGDDAQTQKAESRDEQLEDEVELDEKSAEYEETGDDDDDLEARAKNAGFNENNPEVSQGGEESRKLDLIHSSAEDDDSERQDLFKRETGVAEEEYEDIEDPDGTCEDVSLVDESSYQQAKIRSKAGLLEEKKNGDSQVKRHDVEASGNVLEKNEAPDEAKQKSNTFRQFENVKEDSDDNPKLELSQTGIQRKNVKRQAPSENLAKNYANGEVKAEIKRGNDETDEGSKREAGLQKEFQTDSKDKINNGEKIGSGDPIIDDVDKNEVKMGAETKADVEDDGNSSEQGSNLDATNKDDELDSDYEKKVEEQIQRKINSIKEEIKREVEEKQKIREIEANNAKYDEIQSEVDEDEDEDNQSLDIPNERNRVSKRSIIDGIRSPTKRHILRRIKRSDTTDARQLRAIEGVEKLEPDVLAKAQLLHESIRKRSAPIYGAADKDAPDTSKLLITRSASPRRVYLVNNEQKRSPFPKEREARNTMIIPEQAHVNIEDELPSGLSLDPNLLEDSSSLGKYRFKRSPDRFARRRRASAVVPEGRVAFIGYRPQDDDENDEGSEFDDDGFEDRTSNLQQDKSYVSPHISTRNQYHGDEPRDENPANFLFAGVDRGRNDFFVRRKRAGIRDDEEPARLHGGGALARRQTRAKNKQLQNTKITSSKNLMDRDKRRAGNGLDDIKSDSVASLVGSSQELSPRLATEYKEAFGGLQSDPSGALARFKRVKRDVPSG